MKVKIGDDIVQMSKQEALFRKLLDIGLGGNVPAMRLALAHLLPAHAELTAAAPESEPPLTEAELAVLATIMSEPGDDNNG